MNLFEPYQDIPRLYSAIAECIACYVSIALFPRRRKLAFNIFAGVLLLIIQSALLVTTGGLKIYFWLPIMLLATFIMFAYLKICCRMQFTYTGYITAMAFLQAELAASLEWQLHCYVFKNFAPPHYVGILILILIYSSVFTLFYVLSKNTIKDLEYNISVKELMSAVAITAFAFAFSNISFITSNLPFTSNYRQEIFNIRTLTDLLGLAVLYSYQNRIGELKLKSELDSMQTILNSQYQNFLNFKESIDVINIKYHDLRHQITALRQENDPTKREKWIDAMEQELELYNINFDTGNKVLDTILATKELQCKKYGINITFLVNGEPLSFMSDIDIVSLFSNALDNAIEAVTKIGNPEKRLIHLQVSEKKNFLLILCENTCMNKVVMHGGVAKTTKRDKQLHGFGLKSIKYTVKKYNGNVMIDTKDNWFHMSILIPLKKEA